MTKTEQITYAELRSILKRLGFSEKRDTQAWILHHPSEGLLVYRLYNETEAVDEGDLRGTRKFLDLRGLLDAKEFDRFVRQASAPA